MALKDTLRNLIGLPDDDYDDDYDDDMQSGNMEQDNDDNQMPVSSSSDRKPAKMFPED